ncbi:hypothetical protein EVJ58_g7573 [Rhodofomes roseus]|uniref:Uncharacterized protein n=1 Tax=Rhodofomes roseus TaxID=34475 RepID=A0A4Y9Y6X7_9APHY|nr:hypothetical protein EVJ58_g7573 [Rhodofomes roseus]
MPNTWSTEEQNEWFADKREAFLAAQKAGKVSAFFTEAEGQFFERWPELTRLFGSNVALSTLTPEQEDAYRDALVARKKRIHAKFYNQHSKLKKGEANGVSLTSLLNASGKNAGTRNPQELEVYMKLYYKDRVQSGVEAEIKEHNIPNSKTIGVVRRHTQLAYDNETEEVKAEVKAKLAELKGAAAVKQSTNPSSTLSPAEYQRTINALPRLGQELTRTLCLNSGWSAFLLIGGPCPEEGGALKTMAFFDGETVAGHTFKQTYMSYEENVIDPWNLFLKAAFPREERLRRALSSTPEPDPPESSAANGHGQGSRHAGLAAPLPSSAPQPIPASVTEEDLTRDDPSSTSSAVPDERPIEGAGLSEVEPMERRPTRAQAEEAGLSAAEAGPSLTEDTDPMRAGTSVTYSGAMEDHARTTPADAVPFQPVSTYDPDILAHMGDLSPMHNTPSVPYDDALLFDLLPSAMPSMSAPFSSNDPLTGADATRFLLNGVPGSVSSGDAVGTPSLLDMLHDDGPFPDYYEGSYMNNPAGLGQAAFAFPLSAPSTGLPMPYLPELAPSGVPFVGTSSWGDSAPAWMPPTSQVPTWQPQATEPSMLSANEHATPPANEHATPSTNEHATPSANATSIGTEAPQVEAGPALTPGRVEEATMAEAGGRPSSSPAVTDPASQQPSRAPLFRVNHGQDCPSATPDVEQGRPRRERHAPKPRDADWSLTGGRPQAKENRQVDTDTPVKRKGQKRGAGNAATPNPKRQRT